MSSADQHEIEVREEAERAATAAAELRARYSAPPRWPSVPRELPTQTPDLLANTSIESARLPPPGRAVPSVAERIALVLLDVERNRQARERILQEEEQEEQERQARRVQRADRKADELSAHRRGHDALYNNLVNVLHSHQNDGAFEQSKGSLEEFLKHVENARIVTSAPAREYDIIGWYKKMPDDVTRAVVKMIKHFHTKATLLVELNKLEIQAGSWGSDIHPHEAYAGDYTRKGGSAFGYEAGGRRQEFETYESPLEEQIHFHHLVASFEVRKIRILHAEKGLRATGKEPEAVWKKTLDYSLIKFMKSATIHIAETAMNWGDPLLIKHLVEAFVHTAIREGSRDLVALVNLFQAILDRLEEIAKENETGQPPKKKRKLGV